MGAPTPCSATSLPRPRTCVVTRPALKIPCTQPAPRPPTASSRQNQTAAGAPRRCATLAALRSSSTRGRATTTWLGTTSRWVWGAPGGGRGSGGLRPPGAAPWRSDEALTLPFTYRIDTMFALPDKERMLSLRGSQVAAIWGPRPPPARPAAHSLFDRSTHNQLKNAPKTRSPGVFHPRRHPVSRYGSLPQAQPQEPHPGGVAHRGLLLPPPGGAQHGGGRRVRGRTRAGPPQHRPPVCDLPPCLFPSTQPQPPFPVHVPAGRRGRAPQLPPHGGLWRAHLQARQRRGRGDAGQVPLEAQVR